ncbi:hypothetical protein ACFOPN_21480 [Xanthomonas hyacinthi]
MHACGIVPDARALRRRLPPCALPAAALSTGAARRACLPIAPAMPPWKA